MALTLYNFPQSTCSQKVRVVMWERGIEFEDRIVDHKSREHLQEWYLKLNPNGVVPTIVHDDAIIIDSSVILEYLDEVFPNDPHMVPTDPVVRAHMRKWMRYFEEVPTAAIRVPSFNKYLSKRYANLSQDEYEQMAESHPIRKQFYERMRKENGFDDRETDESLDRLNQAAVRVEDTLKDGRPWLIGEQLTIADAAYLPTIDRMNDLGLAYLWDDKPHVAAWYARYQEREAFAKTFYPGTRLTDIFEKDAA